MREIFERNKDIYMVFIDLEKTYDRIDRNALRQGLRIYAVGGSLSKAVQRLYSDSRAYLRGDAGVRKWFDVNEGLSDFIVFIQYV